MPFTSASGNQKNTSEVEESCRRTRTQAASSLPPGNGQDNEQGTMERAQRQQQILHPLRGSPPNEGSNHDQLAAAVAISSFPRHAQAHPEPNGAGPSQGGTASPTSSPHSPDRSSGHSSEGVQGKAMAVLYGASPSWPLAHLPNAAAHGPASTALGDSWKAHHHDTNGRTRRPAKLLLAGGVAGALSRTATAPMDRLRMLQQVHRGKEVLSLRQGWMKMVNEGSLRAFWRGNGTNVCKNIPEMGIKLCASDLARQRFSEDGSKPTLAQRLAIGGCAGATAQAAVYPLEVVQTRLAVSTPGTYKGIMDALTKTVAQEGMNGLFRGIIPCMVGILPYAGIDIAVFGLLRERMAEMAAAAAAAATLTAAPKPSPL
mmetsp:Transcript_6729/g.19350  ORF Transcript_6729/g.19350 Transcript_6729/m.19350 type:complete len:372 (-) Transcript_6729:973-2088(-)